MEKKETYTLAEIAKFTQSELVGDPYYVITDFADLESAKATDLSFLHNPHYRASRYETAMKESQAGAIFISAEAPRLEGRNYLIHSNPSLAFQMTIEAMLGGTPKVSKFTGTHPTAVVDESAVVGLGVMIGPHVVIEAGAVIGDRTEVHAGTYIGPSTIIGKECVLQPNVTIRENCRLGDRVLIQCGAVIGTTGFGFSTNEKGRHMRLSHVGGVVIGDDVEIGANTVIDRARFTETRIGRGSKLDSSVVIGHNVQVGEDNLICAQTGIAGSTKTGRFVVIAGQCGIDGHIKIADQVMIAGKGGVTKSILKPGKYGGNPAQPIEQHNRNSVFLRNIESIIASLKDKMNIK